MRQKKCVLFSFVPGELTEVIKDSESSNTEIGIVLFQMYNSQHWHSSQM